MEFISTSAIIATCSAFASVGSAWLVFRKIQKDYRKEHETQEAKVLQAAKEADSKLKSDLETKRQLLEKEFQSKVEALRQEIDNFMVSIEKDLEFIKEKQAGEIKMLGEKIEDLRTELRTQHGQLIQMLTEMIKNKD